MHNVLLLLLNEDLLLLLLGVRASKHDLLLLLERVLLKIGLCVSLYSSMKSYRATKIFEL